MKKMEVLQKVDFYNGEISEDLQKQTSVESTMDVYEVSDHINYLYIVCYVSTLW